MPGMSHGQPDERGTLAAAPRPSPFAALRHRDYRLLLSGEFIATLGKQMQTVAISYQVYQLHHSAVELGLLGLVRLIPVLLSSLAGGVIADQVDRRRLLLVTQPA